MGQMDYLGLKKEVEGVGLLERQYSYYVFKIISTLAAAVAVIAALFYVHELWQQLLVLVILAFVFVQFGLLGHDASHLAMFKSRKNNERAGLFFFGFLTGIGYNHWAWRHNAHHANPNQVGEDPDEASYAQTEEEVLARRGIKRFIYERQQWFFWIITISSVTAYQVYGIVHNIRMKSSFVRWADSLLMALHLAVFWILPFFVFPVWKAIIFVPFWRLAMGLYFGAISATNHKGMRVLKKGEKLGFVEKQVITTRNVRPGLLNDFFYGGLNYQIEHHLFSDMPRNNLGRCKQFVMKFCKEKNIHYEETGVLQSYIDIIRTLKRVSIGARKRRLLAKKTQVTVPNTVKASQ